METLVSCRTAGFFVKFDLVSLLSYILLHQRDFRTERTEVRRGRRLVLSFISTVGNYEYGRFVSCTLDGL